LSRNSQSEKLPVYEFHFGWIAAVDSGPKETKREHGDMGVKGEILICVADSPIKPDQGWVIPLIALSTIPILEIYLFEFVGVKARGNDWPLFPTLHVLSVIQMQV
jgi:hypothetical protein